MNTYLIKYIGIYNSLYVCLAFIVLYYPTLAIGQEIKIERYNKGDLLSVQKKVPDMDGLHYMPNQIHFKEASIEQKKAAFRGTDEFVQINDKGIKTKIKIDLASVPYWVYAFYQDKKCSYVLVDGFTRQFADGLDPNTPIPEAPIKWEDGDFGPVILENCGSGYSVISSEAYDSIFDNPMPKNVHLSDQVRVGLASSFVQSLTKAFKGADNLRSILGKDKNKNFYNAPLLLVDEFKKQAF